MPFREWHSMSTPRRNGAEAIPYSSIHYENHATDSGSRTDEITVFTIAAESIPSPAAL